MENRKVVLITGANKGIGYGMLDALISEKSNFDYILTARNEKLGQEALNKLQSNCETNIYFHQLDITSQTSVAALVAWLEEKQLRIDILVNNAGILTTYNEINLDHVDKTFETNYFSTVSFTTEVLKSILVNENGKIIFVGSSLGNCQNIPNETVRNRMAGEDLTKEDLDEIAADYRRSVEQDTCKEDQVYTMVYGMSKCLINCYAKVLGRYDNIVKKNIQVFSCCPGYTATDLTGNKGTRTVEEGVVCPVWLVKLPEGISEETQGQFFYDCKLTPIF